MADDPMPAKFQLGQGWVSRVTGEGFPEVSAIGADLSPMPANWAPSSERIIAAEDALYRAINLGRPQPWADLLIELREAQHAATLAHQRERELRLVRFAMKRLGREGLTGEASLLMDFERLVGSSGAQEDGKA